MSNNTAQKALIETLTKTHQNAPIAYVLARNKLKEQEAKEQINRIAKKFNIKI